MNADASLLHDSLSCTGLTSGQPFSFKDKAPITWKFPLEKKILHLHPVTNGLRLQVGDQAYTSTSKYCLGEAICYPQGIYHNIPSPSKLFIWRSGGNKKHLLSYRLYLDCPSSGGSTCLTVCCTCVHVCMCVCACGLEVVHVYALKCVHHPIAISVWLPCSGDSWSRYPSGVFGKLKHASRAQGEFL